MISKYLENHYRIDKLSSSYLIVTDDIQSALVELEGFLQNKFLVDQVKINNSADYLCVKRSDNKTKNITVDQVRGLQNFLNKTSVISGKKFAVIYEADTMNLNAANSCLKMLEEPTKSTYIFLITENLGNILPTIRSRCVKLNHSYNLDKDKTISSEFIIPILITTPIKDKLEFIKKFAEKDRKLWFDFSQSMLVILAHFIRASVDNSINLPDYELKLFQQFKTRSPLYIQTKYREVKEMVDNTNIYDLDLRSNVVLLIDKMRY
jgi:DNA polymerase III subunit delta'